MTWYIALVATSSAPAQSRAPSPPQGRHTLAGVYQMVVLSQPLSHGNSQSPPHPSVASMGSNDVLLMVGALVCVSLVTVMAPVLVTKSKAMAPASISIMLHTAHPRVVLQAESGLGADRASKVQLHAAVCAIVGGIEPAWPCFQD